MKIVVNRCYGGFSLSRKGVLLGRRLSKNPEWGGANIKGDVYEDGKKVDRDYGYVDVPRNDEILVKVVETLGEKANNFCSKLEVVEIPDNIEWEIEEYDGREWVSEKHEKW